jgi:hypothetical protein
MNKGGRPTKRPLAVKKAKLSLLVPPETKGWLDESRQAGRTQAEEAVRLIGLGRLFEQITAYAEGPSGLVHFYMTSGNPSELEHAVRWHALYGSVLTYRANHPIRKLEEITGQSAPEPVPDDVADDAA